MIIDVGTYLSEADIAQMKEICADRSCSLEAYIARLAVSELQIDINHIRARAAKAGDIEGALQKGTGA